MLLTVENTKHLTSRDFLELLSIELFNSENLYLLLENRREGIPDYFYISAYILEFDTEFEMQGLNTLLANSTTYNFYNALESYKKINATPFVDALEGIIAVLQKFGLTPMDMRDKFITELEFEKIATELRVFEKKLYEIYADFWDYLVSYLMKVRGK